MSGVMLNFKGKMYKLCEKKDMDRKPNKRSSKPVEVDRKIRKDKGKTHTKPKSPAKPKSAPPKSAPPKSKPKPKSAPPKPKTKAKKAKKKIMVEGFPSFKGDEPKAKEEKRRENNLY
tara:strand:+ start:434 stop:784 length:351 start_codon:yes stop_codon:yes gene_type:complete